MHTEDVFVQDGQVLLFMINKNRVCKLVFSIETHQLVDTHIVLLENDMEAISYYAECTILDQD